MPLKRLNATESCAHLRQCGCSGTNTAFACNDDSQLLKRARQNLPVASNADNFIIPFNLQGDAGGYATTAAPSLGVPFFVDPDLTYSHYFPRIGLHSEFSDPSGASNSHLLSQNLSGSQYFTMKDPLYREQDNAWNGARSENPSSFHVSLLVDPAPCKFIQISSYFARRLVLTR
jgi:hypothetical protein